ncbi:C4-dicarboxylate TRAP transporter substrate-binding protein [Roseovarius sp.]|uniref:C4-dicarboxylate TRAP transporter substrate-binding protein n=1 Tax=Roseovarius sp. TaxID=1486281 RepID=UPI0035616D26
MGKALGYTAALVTALGCIPLAAGAETFRLSIGAGHPASAVWVGSVQDYFATEVSARVAERTDHEIDWTHGYGGSICKLGECLEAVEAGLLDMALIGTAFEPSKLQAHNFSYFVPFGLSDPIKGAEAFKRTYDEVPELKTFLEDRYNQKFVGVSTIGDYGLSTTFPWASLSDLQGHKIAGAGPNLPWLEGTGIVPVQTTLNDAYTSLQTGVYEGWIMYADALASFKLIEVAKHFADMNFGVIGFPLLTINLDTWDELPPEVQEILLEAGKNWNVRNAEMTATKQAAAFETMRAQGVEVREVSLEEKKVWAVNMPNLPKLRYDEAMADGQPGQAIYTYIDILKSMGHEFPRDWSLEK